MPHWIRFEHEGMTGFGTLSDGVIEEHEGDLFDGPAATGRQLDLAAVRVLTPAVPGKMIALWNNYHELAEKLELAPPAEPLYFFKAGTSFIASGETIRRPPAYDGRVVYEGELGIVIGKRAAGVAEDEAPDHIFGYTCINDVTAIDLLNRDPTFPQWARAKSFDGFGAFGPVIATDIDPLGLSVRTLLNGEERQNYQVRDMIFRPARLVSLLSRDMTLLPGDVIACGTSLGVGSMKQPRNTVEVTIDGIGTLTNIFEQ